MTLTRSIIVRTFMVSSQGYLVRIYHCSTHLHISDLSKLYPCAAPRAYFNQHNSRSDHSLQAPKSSVPHSLAVHTLQP